MSTNETAVLPLPELPKEQQGTSTASHNNYTASVSNAAGYLCHIHLDCHFDVPPEVIFEIFCHPDNAGAFRDIKCVGYRKVKQQEPGFKVVEVEQCGELRVLWIHRVFRTYLDVTEDARDPECLKTEFTLLRSDLLSRFHGSWELRPKRDEAGQVVGCHAVLNQDVLPKGVPTFFAHLPVLGGMLRRVSLGTIQRLVEDILNIVKKYMAGNGQLTVDDVIAKIAAERGHNTIEAENREGTVEDALAGDAGSGSSSDNNNNNNGASNEHIKVTSFAIESFSDSESEVGEESDAKEQQLDRQNATAEGAKLQQLKLSNDGRSSSGGSSGRQSADGVVTITPSAPNSKDGTAAASPTTAEGAAAVSKGLAAAVCAELPQAHKQQQHRSHKQHRHAHKEHPAVGVLLDVTVHEHVHVSLIPNPAA